MQEAGLCRHCHSGRFAKLAWGKAEVSDLQVTKRKTMLKIINEMCEAGEIIPLSIEGDHKIINYVLPETLNGSNRRKKKTEKIHILSPFDNLIIQRDRTKRLFDLDYAIECYLPEHKREYGYFVLPILWGNKFVGRMDSKADRKTRKFIINNIVFEEGFNDFDTFIPQLKEKLNEFVIFNDCEELIVKKCQPAAVKKTLNAKH